MRRTSGHKAAWAAIFGRGDRLPKPNLRTLTARATIMSDYEWQTEKVPLTHQELDARLGWLIELRWFGVAGLLLGALNGRLVVGPRLDFGPLLAFTVLLSVINVVFMLVNRGRQRSGHIQQSRNSTFAMLQIAVDLAMVTMSVHWTGGVSSVLVICYAFHMVLASELLGRWLAFSVAALASVMFDGVVFFTEIGALQRHMIDGFTLGSWSEGGLHAREVAHICLLYNMLFFAMVYIASSISGRLREREDEVEEVNRELRRVNRAKSDFMSMASHELRTPLAAVEGLLSMIGRTVHREMGYHPECEDLMRRGINRIQSMRDLVDDLLAYSRLQALGVGEGKTRVNLAAVAEEALEQVEPMADHRGVAITSDLQRCEMEGVPEQLCSLMQNLLANAVRYSHHGGEVHLRVRPEGENALIEVEDHGIGIETEALDQVFEEFFRAPSAKEFEPGGTGLGLTLCQRIAKRHGGRILVDSEPGVRTVFSVVMRLRSADE